MHEIGFSPPRVTLPGLKLFLRQKFEVAAIVTTGGELKELAQKHELPLVLFSAGGDLTPHLLSTKGAGLTPRQAVDKMYHGLVKILQIAGFKLNAPEFTTSIRGHLRRWAETLPGDFSKNSLPFIPTNAIVTSVMSGK